MANLAQTVDLLSVLADPTRVRLLAVLEDVELSVAEITRITDLPQSRVSTHLRKLKSAGMVRDRREGSSSFYGLDPERQGVQARELWKLLHGRLSDDQLDRDRRRREAALAARKTPLRWPDEVAGQMERHYSPGRTWEATMRGLLGFLRLGEVLDVGSGDGVNAELLAPRAQRVTCLDISERVIAAARRRLEHVDNVDFRVGDMHELPFEAERFDAVLLLHTLTYSARPREAIAEATRVLRPGGALAVVTLIAHGHEKISRAYDHVNLGFEAPVVESMLRDASLEVEQCAASSRERRKPYFQVLTAFARKAA